MSFSPATGLVYIPTNHAIPFYRARPDWKESDDRLPDRPRCGKAHDARRPEGARGDPQAVRRRAGRVGSGRGPGGLVGALHQGHGTAARSRPRATWCSRAPRPANSVAYTADTGDKLWSFPTQTGVHRRADDLLDRRRAVRRDARRLGRGDGLSRRQLVGEIGRRATSAGCWCSSWAPRERCPRSRRAPSRCSIRRRSPARPTQLIVGEKAYGRSCSVCHGDAAVAGALNPDLRHSAAIGNAETWKARRDRRRARGQRHGRFEGAFSPADAEAIRQYVIKRANEDKALEQR